MVGNGKEAPVCRESGERDILTRRLRREEILFLCFTHYYPLPQITIPVLQEHILHQDPIR
jgi:hypothetical protein